MDFPLPTIFPGNWETPFSWVEYMSPKKWRSRPWIPMTVIGVFILTITCIVIGVSRHNKNQQPTFFENPDMPTPIKMVKRAERYPAKVHPPSEYKPEPILAAMQLKNHLSDFDPQPQVQPKHTKPFSPGQTRQMTIEHPTKVKVLNISAAALCGTRNTYCIFSVCPETKKVLNNVFGNCSVTVHKQKSIVQYNTGDGYCSEHVTMTYYTPSDKDSELRGPVNYTSGYVEHLTFRQNESLPITTIHWTVKYFNESTTSFKTDGKDKNLGPNPESTDQITITKDCKIKDSKQVSKFFRHARTTVSSKTCTLKTNEKTKRSTCEPDQPLTCTVVGFNLKPFEIKNPVKVKTS